MTNEGEVTRVIARVRQTLDQGKFAQALRDLLHLSEKYPDAGEIKPEIAEVYLRRGQSRVRKGKIKEARQDFEHSLRWAEFSDTYVQLGRTALKEGDLEGAHKHLNQAIEIDDHFGPAHEQLGYLFLRWNEPGEASRAFEQALLYGHATPDLYRGVWNAYMALERVERAHELILEGSERFPENDGIQTAAGDSFVYARGDSNQAEPYWRRAIELSEKNVIARFQLAGLLASRGIRGEALDLLRHCAKVDLEKTRKLWREDMESPLRRFGDFADDPDFRTLLDP